MSREFIEVGAPRLLALADILDAADELHRERGEPMYNQGDWAHRCGTPACAMGHWAASEEGAKRWGFRKDSEGYMHLSPHMPLLHVKDEFHISMGDSAELFGGYGCGGARNAKQAADYIRRFVERRLTC